MYGAAEAITTNAIPAHVPPELVYDFDLYEDPKKMTDLQLGFMELHGKAPDLFFTPRHGGHWIATRYDNVMQVVTTPTVFSRKLVSTKDGDPSQATPVPPLDMDPPEHMRYRLLMLKFLSPKAVKKLEPQIRGLINELIDQLDGRSSCEFKADIAVILPSAIFMGMMKMDKSRLREFVGWVNDSLECDETTKAAAAFAGAKAYLAGLIEERRENPGDDPISMLATAEVQGERLPTWLVQGICNLLFLAGLHTVTSAMTFIMHHLAQHPEEQRHLRAHPERIPAAIEELLRRYSFVNVARRVTQDFEFNGVQLKEGDKVVISLPCASNDDRKTADPAEVDLGRSDTEHLAFASGAHVCAGAPLARLELKVFLEEWLRRMPDVAIAPGFRPHIRGGNVMGLSGLELVW